jgi:hypothetical protein
LGIFILKARLNTKLMLAANISGVTTAHHNPSLEPAYFALNWEIAISHNAWRKM